MPSIESGTSEEQSGNLSDDLDTSGSILRDRELDDAIRDVDSNFWEAPVPNRLTAAFHIGRLLNQLSWHFQRVLFGSRADKASVGKVLDRLVGVSFKLMDEPPNHLSEVINDVRSQFEGQLWQNEAASDAVIAACYDEVRDSDCLDGENRRQELFDLWVDPLLRPVRNSISNTLTVTEQWAFELGNCLDEGIRRPDLYRFVTARRYTRSGYYSDDINKCGPRWGASGVRMRSFQPGELQIDTAWVQKLRGLLEKAGVPSPSIKTTLSTWEQAKPNEQRSSVWQLLEHLDRCVREHFGAFDIETAGTTTQETSTETQAHPEEITAELPLSPVSVDGQPSAEQSPAEKTVKRNIIPDKFLSRILTKKEAAEIHFGRKVKNPTEYIGGLVKGGLMTQPQGSGRKWRFDTRDFDAVDQHKVRRRSDESSDI